MRRFGHSFQHQQEDSFVLWRGAHLANPLCALRILLQFNGFHESRQEMEQHAILALQRNGLLRYGVFIFFGQNLPYVIKVDFSALLSLRENGGSEKGKKNE